MTVRKTSLTAAIALAMGIAALNQTAAIAASDTPVVADVAKTRYLVYFEEPAVASFRGFDVEGISPKSAADKALQATSPAVTGARHLDVDAPASRAYRKYLGERRQDRLQVAEKRVGRALEPEFVYDLATNGVALSLTGKEAVLLRGVPGVTRVVPEFTRRPMTDNGPRWIHADQIWNGPGDIANEGEGVVIGVIDTGINASHPSFAATGPVDGYVHSNPRAGRLGLCSGGAGGCNDKLIGIYDFTTGSDDAEPNDGSDKVGHGSHVASTAAGNHIDISLSLATGSVTRHLSGVAPHANIIAYKACEDEASCQGSWLMAAIDRAVADQVDVISYSIGGGTNNPWSDGDSLQMLGARQAGVVPVIAAGNDGPGESTVSSPGNAPWVLSAANASHDRVRANRLKNLSGGDTPAPDGGVLVGAGITQGYGPADIIYAGDHGSALCAQGPNSDALPPDGSTNPWPTSAGQQPFNGQIVVCDRGTYARVIKSFNVGQAGGGGFVLVNSSAEGESIVADPHSIPGVHLGFQAGQELKQWLASGSGHKATIEGDSILEIPSFGDLLASSSGRGPVLWGSYLTPNITAPGTNIIAAAGTGNGTATFSGTSMATPHISGAVALLINAHPDWDPAQLTSALLTTARSSVKLDADTPANPLEQGSGTADLAKAVRAGLYFPIARSDFDAAKLGDTRAMNLPALVDNSCFLGCSQTRTVKDMAGGGSWTAVLDLPAGATGTATPSSFTLAAGESRAINFSFNVAGASVSGGWVFGHLRLQRTEDDGISDVEIPVAIKSEAGDLPESIEIEADAESGFVDINLQGLVALPEARFASSKLADRFAVVKKLKRGSLRSEVYQAPFNDSLLETFAAAPAAVARVLTVSASAPNTVLTRLYVGIDSNGDGLPSENEELCRQTDSTNSKTCRVDVPPLSSAVNLWVMAQNYQPGTAVIEDQVTVTHQLVDPSLDAGTQLAITGPGHIAQGASFPVRISWDTPDLLPGQTKTGYLLLGAEAGREGKTGSVPVNITRVGETHAAAALVSGRTRSMKLAAGAAQDRLFIEVPGNATRLQIDSAGSGEVDLYAAWAGPSPGPISDVTVAAAPARGDAEGTSIHAGANESIDLQGQALKPGRWYITPVNTGTEAASFDLTASISYGSAAPPVPQFSGYYNPARSGAGVFLYRSGSAWAVLYYGYLEDGSPTWYLGAALAPEGNAGSWTVPLDRYSWDGDSAYGRRVGEATLTSTSSTAMTISMSIDGKVGSESMQRVDPGTCPSDGGGQLDLTGSWYAPTQPGYGFSVTAISGLEAVAAYIYDDSGIARWTIGSTAPFGGTSLPMSVFVGGSCSYCAYQAATPSVEGSYVRSYNGATGNAALDVVLPSPLSGHWQSNAPILPLTSFATCVN